MERRKATVRTLKKVVREMNVGEKFYFNAIAGTIAMTDYIRSCIIDGTLQPAPEWVDGRVKPEAITKVLSGEIILPQCEYIKKRGTNQCLEL